VNIYYTGSDEIYNDVDFTVSADTCSLCMCGDYSFKNCLLGANYGKVMSFALISVLSTISMF
jgi:hypothetical protein